MAISNEIKNEIKELVNEASKHLMELSFLWDNRTSDQILPYLRFHDRCFNNVYSLAYDAVVNSSIQFDQIDKYYGQNEKFDALLDLWRNDDIETEAIGLYLAAGTPENFCHVFSGYLKNYSNYKEIINNPPSSVTSISEEISGDDFVDRCINKFRKDFMEQLYDALAEEFGYVYLDGDSIFKNDYVVDELECLSASFRLGVTDFVDISIDQFRMTFLEQLYEELAVEFDEYSFEDASSITEGVVVEQLEQLSSNLKYCLENNVDYPEDVIDQSSRSLNQKSIDDRKNEVEKLIDDDFNKYEHFIDENILKKGNGQKIKKRKTTN